MRLVSLLWLLACARDPKDTGAPIDAFPDGFLWGTAVAGFQVDAGCPTLSAEDCEDEASDWYQWVTDPELLADPDTHLSGEALSLGPGWTELYAEDMARAADELNNGAIRFSVEWSRLFPDGAAEAATSVDELYAFVDPDGLAYTQALIDAAVAEGLTPLVTLNHYTLPLWIHDGKSCHADPSTCEDRGWADAERIVPAIALYAGFCGREFGDRVDLWATQNEPLAVVMAGYLYPSAERTNPPGVSDPELGAEVMFALARGHRAMLAAVRAEDAVDADGDGAASQVGVVANLAAIAPGNPERAEDLVAAEHADYVYNRAWLNAAARGQFDEDLDGETDVLESNEGLELDFLGINYYTRITVVGLGGPLFGDLAMTDFLPTVLWEEYPEGMAEVVAVGQDYGAPIYITENGTGAQSEDAADAFLVPHLEALRGAIEEGADVRGYFYWTLVDNYEWNHGMTAYQFGLYGLDLETKERTLRPLGERYAEIARQNGI